MPCLRIIKKRMSINTGANGGDTDVSCSSHPLRSGMGPLMLGFSARVREVREPAQPAPAPQAAGTVPDSPESVKSTMEAAVRPARSVRLPTLQVPWNTLGPSWEMTLQADEHCAKYCTRLTYSLPSAAVAVRHTDTPVIDRLVPQQAAPDGCSEPSQQ